jgi:hypothetical protein
LPGAAVAHQIAMVDQGDKPLTGDPRPDRPEAVEAGTAPRARSRLAFGWIAMIVVVFAVVSLIFIVGGLL